MQLYLRDALPTDVQPLVALLLCDKLAHPDDTPTDVGGYATAIHEIDERDDNFLIVAELGGRVVGMIQLITFRHFQHRGGRCAEIESLHVADDVRRRGIGTRLVHHAVQRARDLGCYRIQLTSNTTRDCDNRFYEHNEFVSTHAGYKRYLR